MPIANVNGSDALVKGGWEGYGKIGMVGNIDATVITTIFSCCNSCHISTLQGEGTSFIAVFTQAGSVANTNRERALISGCHEGRLRGSWNHHCSAHPYFYTAITTIDCLLTVDCNIAQIRASNLAGADVLEHKPRSAPVQVHMTEVLKRSGTNDVIVYAIYFHWFGNAIVILLRHTIFVGEDSSLSHLS